MIVITTGAIIKKLKNKPVLNIAEKVNSITVFPSAVDDYIIACINYPLGDNMYTVPLHVQLHHCTLYLYMYNCTIVHCTFTCTFTCTTTPLYTVPLHVHLYMFTACIHVHAIQRNLRIDMP